MISYLTYKNIHLLGIFLLMISLGGLMLYSLNGGQGKPPTRRLVAITHGLGLLLALVGGFGLVARLQIPWPWPGWLLGKVVIWLFFGGLLAIVPKKPKLVPALWWLTAFLGATAAYLALNKPWT